MKTLKIDEKKARKLYRTASEEFRATLEDTFGEEFFSDNITDLIKSYEDACEDQGIEPLEIEDFRFLPAKDRLQSFREHQLKVITQSLNEGWEPDFSNHDQYKYWVYVYVDAAGVACVRSYYAPAAAYTYIGSRLCYKNRSLADYSASQFEGLWKEARL